MRSASRTKVDSFASSSMFDETSARTRQYVLLLTICLGAAAMLACCRSQATTGGFVAVSFTAGLLLFLTWRRGDVSLPAVLLLALCFRAAFLWLPPSLSDDAYRYVWDGLVQLHGYNPYLVLPADGELGFLHQEPLYPALNSPTYYSVYPPVSQLIFRLGASFYELGWQASYYAIKLILACCEAAALWLLSRRIEPRLLLLYAWNPLVILAAAGQAHSESAAVLFLVAAWLFAERDRGGWASAAVAAAGLVKLYPFVLLPLLWHRFGWRSVWPAALTIALLSAPYADPAAIPNMYASLDLYVRSFEFNAGFYYAIKKALEIATGVDWSKQIGPALRWVFLASLPAVYIIARRRDWSFRRAAVVVAGIFFVTSTTVHPWYLLPVLAMTAVVRPPSWHWWWLSIASLGTYLLYVSGPYWAWVIAGWAGWFALAGARYFDSVIQISLRRRAGGKAHLVADSIDAKGENLSILDLGAAEGYVGSEIAKLTNAHVTLVDVADRNRTELTYIVYDGEHLPFERDRFDVVALVYVLHHAVSPEAVLREAARVCAGSIIVIESIRTGPVQGRLFAALDYTVNLIRSAGARERHSQYPDGRGAHPLSATPRKFEEWILTFHDLELNVDTACVLGGMLHRRALYVVSKRPNPDPVSKK